MDSADAPQFEDPALKQALRRCCGSECAPIDFRARLAKLLVAAAEVAPVPAPRFRNDAKRTMFIFGRNTMAGLGIAAALLVVVGLAAMRLMRSSHENVPSAIGLAMVDRHDRCCQQPEHHQADIPRAALPAIASAMRNQLGFPVLAANLVNDGWHFRGASKCPVGDVRSAHLLFDKGEETISVFSLPAGSFPAVDQGHWYEAVVQNHPVVCYARDGAVFAFVGHDVGGKLKLAELESLAKRHQSDTVIAATFVPTRQFAELIHSEQ